MLNIEINKVTGNNLLDITPFGDFYKIIKDVNNIVEWTDINGGIALLDADTILNEGYLSKDDYTAICNKINEVNIALGSPTNNLDVNVIVEGMPQKTFIDSFLSKINELIDYINTDRVLKFEEMFQSDEDYEGSKFRITNGKIYIQELYTNHVLVSNLVTDTGDARGQYILYGVLSLYNRDDSKPNQLGSLVHELTKDTVFSFAFNPSNGDWIPFHGQFTCWSRDFKTID